MAEVNENSTSVVTCTFKDENSNAVIPSDASYRIDDVASGTQIKGWTTFVPISSVHDITILDTENVMIDSTKGDEERCLSVKFTYGIDSKKGTGEYYYTLINLFKVP